MDAYKPGEFEFRSSYLPDHRLLIEPELARAPDHHLGR
jgi:hypothetical protein